MMQFFDELAAAFVLAAAIVVPVMLQWFDFI